MYTQVGKSYYLHIKIMPFTKRYFVIGKKLFKSLNIFSNKAAKKFSLQF